MFLKIKVAVALKIENFQILRVAAIGSQIDLRAIVF
jgi:hypothetical protein